MMSYHFIGSIFRMLPVLPVPRWLFICMLPLPSTSHIQVGPPSRISWAKWEFMAGFSHMKPQATLTVVPGFTV